MNINTIGKDCCGCRSCEQSCPKKCITMKENDEGFIYPIIDSSLCINCGVCLKKCPVYNYKNKEQESKVYALVNNDKEKLKKSASGGAAYLASQYIIKELDGVVYGVAYDEEFTAKTIRVDNIEDLKKLQSSKYVFADTNDTYSRVKDDLNKGLNVLFIGTSCQVEGLLKFLGNDYERLFTISLICHGAPSPKLFKAYLNDLEESYNSKIVSYNHRFKLNDKTGYAERIEFENGKALLRQFDMSPYGRDFLTCNSFRMSCYNCKYCTTNRVGDWSIGDFWGIEHTHRDFNSKDGHSLVIVCTKKGEFLFNEIKQNATYIESNMENAIYGQLHLKKPADKPIIRDKYYEQFNNDPNFFKHRTPKKNLKYYAKKVCPRWIKNLAKKILH